jgi:hypothetical protein
MMNKRRSIRLILSVIPLMILRKLKESTTMLNCLKPLADWEPEYAKEIDANIDSELADEAGVDLATFKSARAIIRWDGWYGPMSDEDYKNEGHAITKSQALKIIDRARQHVFETIKFQNPEYELFCENPEKCGDCCECTNFEIPSGMISSEVWRWYHEIYG